MNGKFICVLWLLNLLMFAIVLLDFGAVPAVWYCFIIIIIIFILFTMIVPDAVRVQ